MALETVLSASLFIPFVISLGIERRATWGQLLPNAPINCWSGLQPANDEGKTDCQKACNTATFAPGKIVHGWSSNTVGSCNVAVVQTRHRDFESRILADACADLINKCPNHDAVAQFESTGPATNTGNGTLKISYHKINVPTGFGSGGAFATELTGAYGDYTLPLRDCQQALNNSIPDTQQKWPRNVNATNAIVGSQGSCSVSIAWNQSYFLSPYAAYLSGLDILNIPSACNNQSLCRQVIGAHLGRHPTPLYLNIPAIQPIASSQASSTATALQLSTVNEGTAG